jgi:hypothetical protein
VARMPRACARRNCRQRGPSRRGIDTSSLENRPHPTCRDLVAKPGEFAVDASIPQEEFSAASRSTNRRNSDPTAAAADSVTAGLSPASLHQVPVPP